MENMESKIRYLEMIQGVIERMGSNSFMLKGWAVTLAVGIFALSSEDSDKLFFLLAYIPTILFWFIDTYYLQLERKYRILYNEAVALDPDQITWSLCVPQSSEEDKTRFIQVFFSKTEIGFYLTLAVLVAIIIILTLIPG